MSYWKAVTRSHPCPICEKDDWCGVTDDGAVRCMRVAEMPGWRVLKTHTDGGTVFRKDDDFDENGTARYVVTKSSRVEPVRLNNWKNVQAELLANGMERTKQRNELAERLGLTGMHLFLLGIGWHKRAEAWTFPMHNPEGTVVGIRVRYADNKGAIRGSRDGIFCTPVPVANLQGPLFIAEGPTDTAALLKLGCMKSIGRSNCRSNVDAIQKLAVGQDVVVVADQDEPGQDGAKMLINHLSGIAKSGAIVTPPAKDLRAWVKAGGNGTDFKELLRKEHVYV